MYKSIILIEMKSIVVYR